MLSWADRVSLTGVDRAHFKANKKADVDARARFAILAQARVGPPPLFASVQAPLLLDKKTTSRLARVYLLSSHPTTILPCKSNGHPPCDPRSLGGEQTDSWSLRLGSHKTTCPILVRLYSTGCVLLILFGGNYLRCQAWWEEVRVCIDLWNPWARLVYNKDFSLITHPPIYKKNPTPKPYQFNFFFTPCCL